MEFSEDEFAHYGILRKSGRYPWGSGGTQEERNRSFLDTVENLRKNEGMSDIEIARGFGMTTTELRNGRAIAKNEEKQAHILFAQKLSDKGMSNVAIGERMGLNESSVRALLKPGELDKLQVLDATSSMLKDQIAEKGYIDVGSGVEQHLAVSSDKLSKSIAKLREEGYTLHYVKVEQLGTGQKTTLKVLAAPDTPYAEVYRNRDLIKLPTTYSDDGGRSYDSVQPPLSISSKRVGIKYAEQGGADEDGVIYIRPGKKDLSLGSARYAQVRIAVDGTHYLKGMAIYNDDMPDGVDLLFNTNKSDTGNKLDAMKKMKDDPTNPFGSVVRQLGVQTPDGKKLTSVMNLVNEEGDWDPWSKTTSSQFLSKQPPTLAKKQLAEARDRKQKEFEELKGLENPAIKKKLLQTLAESADSAAVSLKAAALPRTQNRVILPVNAMKKNEVYAPQFRDGERVVLVRHPHGGIFEIPELIVNNRNPVAKKLLGDAEDAIGIHSEVAAKLSGADFDGDTVLVIPNDGREVKTAAALEGLKNFDPKREYPAYDGMPKMSAREKGSQMGVISNLITDMTIRGASQEELARAIRHSMVVIDAEKHDLNYRKSAIDNGIAALKERYQGKSAGGASTLISKASARIDVPERKQGFKVNPQTGKKEFTETGASYEVTTTSKRTGEPRVEVKINTQRSEKLAETDDAHTLSSGTPIEKIYADHSNAMKALANEARLEALNVKATPYSPEARIKYREQVDTLDAKLGLALRNSPLERQAQVLANSVINAKRDANPDMEDAEIKKLKFAALQEARDRVGAKKQLIKIDPDEWTAIQAGAITNSRLHSILDNTDLDAVKQLATPKARLLMSGDKKTKAIAMLRNGYTQAEVADALGVSISTLKRSLSSEGDS